jgi:HEPN domain-containing protein
MTVKLPELWLQYASDDLKSAKVLLAEEVYNITCFHAQQTVEKLFKAFIAAYDQPIPRTHNLLRTHFLIAKKIRAHFKSGQGSM